MELETVGTGSARRRGRAAGGRHFGCAAADERGMLLDIETSPAHRAASLLHQVGALLARHQTALALLWLLLVPLLLGPEIWRGQQVLGPDRVLDRDALYGVTLHAELRNYDDWTPTILDYPRDVYLAARFAAGHFDLWNPLQGFGMPTLAEQGGVLFPLRLLYYLHPTYIAYGCFRLLRLVIAGWGAYLLSRQRRLSRLSSLGAATLFEVCGGLIAQLPFATGAPIVFLPWVIWGLELLRQGQSRRGLLALSLSLALALSAGHQMLAAVVSLAAAAYGLGMLLGERRAALRPLGLGLLGGGLAALLAAPSLLSFFELLHHGHSYKQSPVGLIHWARWLWSTRHNAFLGLSGGLLIDRARDLAPSLGYPYTLHFLCGLMTSLLALVALCRRRCELPLVAMFVVGAITSFAPPGFLFLYKVPLLRDILPRYLWPLLILPVTQWAGSGADELEQLARARAPAALARTLGLGLQLFVAAWLLGLLALLTERTFFPHELAALLGAIIAEPWRLLGPLYGLLFGGLLLGLAGWISPSVVRPLALLLAVGELAATVRLNLCEPPSLALQRPLPGPAQQLAALTAAERVRIATADYWLATAQLPMLAGIADARMTSPLVPRRYHEYFVAAGNDAASSFYRFPTLSSPYVDLAAVRYGLSARSAAEQLGGDPQLVRRFDTFGATVYENLASAPRARLLHRAMIAAGPEQARDELHSWLLGKRHLADSALGTVVIVEPTASSRPPPLELPLAAEAATIESLRPDRVEVTTASSAAGYLLLADLYYPGWHAYVDGRRQPIYPANLAFRAVYLEPGRHRVSFRYEPLSLRLGIGGTSVALLILLAIACSRRKIG